MNANLNPLRSPRPLALAMLVMASMTAHTFGALLGVQPGFPKVNFNNTSSVALTYDAAGGGLSVISTPTLMLFSATQPKVISSGSLTIMAKVDNSGNLVVGGLPGDNFVLTGTVTAPDATVYTGVLLTGTIVAFGYLESGITDQYDFRFNPTGGSMLSLFQAGFSVSLTSEISSFVGAFDTDFNGRAKGIVGAEDFTFPAITCPDDVVAECHADPQGQAGVYVSYPAPTVTDNWDPSPTVVCDPPSGSFFPLPPGQTSAQYVVTCTATDSAGNVSTCSFTVTVQDTLPPDWEDPMNPVIDCPITDTVLDNDPGKCYATFTFPRPYAIDVCCGPSIPTNVGAMDENGAEIPLVDDGNGNLTGQFPVNKVGFSIITITASDSRGNSRSHICNVTVLDKEAPVLACQDQTATFKPVVAAALSCISEDISLQDLKAGDYLWFSNVLHARCNRSDTYSVHVFDQSVTFKIDGRDVVLNVPEAIVTFQNGLAVASTSFVDGKWITNAMPRSNDGTFVSGLAHQVPQNFPCNKSRDYDRGGRRCHVERDRGRGHGRSCRIKMTWCGRFEVSQPDVAVYWQWGVAAYYQLRSNNSALCVKPIGARQGSGFNNSDPAGTPECFKQYFEPSDGVRYHCGSSREYTGDLSDCERVNTGKGVACEGPVEFDPPAVTDCDEHVTVILDPPSGTVLGPGDHLITATATDSSGNTSQCTFTVTVLPPLRLVCSSLPNDNKWDNVCHNDEGFSHFNCPDDRSTPQQISKFDCGSKVRHEFKLLDCDGNDVTSQMAGCVTVHLDCTQRIGKYEDSSLVHVLTANTDSTGTPGGICVFKNGSFSYDLDTTGFLPQCATSNQFFRACVWVDYKSSPGVPVAMEDVILESR